MQTPRGAVLIDNTYPAYVLPVVDNLRCAP